MMATKAKAQAAAAAPADGPHDKWEAAAVERAKAQIVTDIATTDVPSVADVEAEKEN